MEKKKKFNFKEEMEKGKALLDSRLLEAVVLSPSGGGKSCLCGTLPGKILYLYTEAEKHGPKNAKKYGGGDVYPFCIDHKRNPDESIEYVVELLNDVDFIRESEFKSIVCDSLMQFETLIRGTSLYYAMCKTTGGKHDGYKEPAAVLSIFNKIMGALRNLNQELGIHYICTCPLDVREKGENGEILASKPQLSTYMIAESLIQQFSDVFVIGQLSKEKEDGTVISDWRIQFLSGIYKDSKDKHERIKKTINYNPRSTDVEKLPRTMRADLKDLIKLKEQQ